MHVPFFDEIEEYMFPKEELRKADLILVPGNRYPQMAMEAARLYREGYPPYVLPSGRYAIGTPGFAGSLFFEDRFSGPYETEWDFLSDVLRKEGVPGSAILREDCATYTWENAQLCRKAADAAGLSVKTAILCCKAVHMRRSLLYFQLAFPEATLLPHAVSPDGVTRENWRTSPEKIREVMAELERIVTQFSLMM